MVELISDEEAPDMKGRQRPPFQTEVQRGGDSVSISLSGTYSEAVPAQLDAEVRKVKRSRVRHLILDLRGLTSVDADGLGTLLADWAEERRDGLVLILVRVPKGMRQLLEQTGLDRQLPISYEGISLPRP